MRKLFSVWTLCVVQYTVATALKKETLVTPQDEKRLVAITYMHSSFHNVVNLSFKDFLNFFKKWTTSIKKGTGMHLMPPENC